MKGIIWLAYGTLAAVLIFIGALFYQGVFQGFFIKTLLPTESELDSLVVDKEDVEYVFDHIAFLEYDLASGRELSLDVSLNTYAQVLDFLNGSARVEFDQHLLSEFEEASLAELVIYVKPKDQRDSSISVPYQRVQFIKNSGDFRVERLGKAGPYIWNYYRLPVGQYIEMVKLIEEGKPS